MLSEITIKNADLTDVPFIEQTEKECFHAPWTSSQIEYEINKDNSVFLVALYEGNHAGYVSADIVCGEVYINNVAVTSAYRNKKTASALMEHLLDSVKENEFITLEVRVSNTPARKLYEKFGFENLGERKDFYSSPRENACIYTKYFEKEILL